MRIPPSRRDFIKLTVASGLQLPLWRMRSVTAARHSPSIAPGPFKPTWESLAQTYRVPEWFRDAKFGIWAHWSAQCVPEQGDWYARRMYQQSDSAYDYHLKTYGHPSRFGFMEIDNLWKAERWEPEKLMALYKRAGAKYFFALANHHDNFDAYDSKYHAWNSVNVGPKKDIVGTWAKVARANGLRFGVSNHSAHSWHWFQAAYGYDAEGPKAGVRYDAARLTKANGKDKWWAGLDPQELYTGPNMVVPDGITSIDAINEWHNKNDLVWNENPPPMNPAFTEKWFLRCQDLVDKYHPDVLYFDNTELPLGQVGLDIVAHYYNANFLRNKGRLEAVVNGKHMKPEHMTALVEDIERGVATGIRPHPWQTDTCIGSWHYSREIAEQNKYKSVGQVIDMLVDIVSKNGNLMLSIPVRGDGTIDEHEVAFLEGMSAWMKVNDDGIFGSRPWKIYGEGPSTIETPETGPFGGARDVRSKGYTIEDIRFTSKGTALYAYLLAPQPSVQVVITSLATTSPHTDGRRVKDVTLVGGTKLEWSHGEQGLSVKLPEKLPSLEAVGLRIIGIL
ncbi:MAG TPA: alpha-L-fucosidase [Pyrinomonadaceae bacterium]|nr:alpha-L-fucosidase [Pyrinomonadaceae bacterium]